MCILIMKIESAVHFVGLFSNKKSVAILKCAKLTQHILSCDEFMQNIPINVKWIRCVEALETDKNRIKNIL